MEIKDLAIQNLSDLREAMLKLESSGLGILFVVNNNQKLLGVLTDGDIRRAMIRGAEMEFSVEKVMNTNFVSLPIETDNTQILHYITEKVKVIPLVDNKNILIDYASINKIRRISVASPNLDGNELAYVTDCIRTNWISSRENMLESLKIYLQNIMNKEHRLQ